MKTAELWNKIVSQYNKIRNSKEEVVQASWELLFSTLFNYSDSEIDSQRPVQMGSTPKYPDIIIKNQNGDLFVVELKQHTLHKGHEQLISYLNQLKVNIGILVCDKLYIYDFDYTAKENAYSVLEIPFTQDNPNGSRFVELFSKDNFDKQKIKDFIKESNQKKNSETEIKNELSVNLITELLKSHFSEKYPAVDVEKILADYNISISKKCVVQPLTHFQAVQKTTNVANRTNEEKLIKDIRSVGMETFVKYFEYYNNPNYETRDIRALFEKYENFSINSMASKASTGKGIIKRGFAKDALTIITNANNISSELRAMASKYLEQL